MHNSLRRPNARIGRFAGALLLAAGLFLPPAGDLQAAPTADLVFRGGPVHTADPARPTAEAVAVGDGRILYVGDAAGVAPFIGRKTRLIELAGRALVPGFVDASARLADMARTGTQVDLSDTKDFADVVRRIGQAARRAPPNSWVLGWGWDAENWGEAEPIRLPHLQEASGKLPVVLFHATDDVLVANVPAQSAANIDDDMPDPPGGRVQRTPGGVRTGELLGEAARLVTLVIPRPTTGELETLYRQAADSCLARGITTAAETGGPVEATAALRALYRDKSRRPALKLWLAIEADKSEFDQVAAEPPGTQDEKSGLYIRGLVFPVDGGLNTRGAALSHPYADDRFNSGYFRSEPAQLAGRLEQAVAGGWQPVLTVHGDSALALATALLDTLDHRSGGAPPSGRRPRLIGLDLVRPDQLERLRGLDLPVTVHPSALLNGQRWIEDRIGLGGHERPHAWKTLVDAGLPVSFGTDAPYLGGSPILAFYLAVTRQDLRGRPSAGWRAEERLDRTSALAALTRAGAAALGLEAETGTIAVGKRADLALLSRDIMSVPEREIPLARVDLTVADGRVVYERTGRP